MNSIVTLVFFLFATSFPFLVSAGTEFQIENKKQSQKKWVEVLKISCSPGDATCELVCQNSTTCELPQMTCVDCVSQTNRLIQTVFRNLKALYVANAERTMNSLDVVEHLKHSRFFVLPHDSYLNVFTPKALEQNRLAFNGLCPNDKSLIKDSLLVVDLDSDLTASKISHVICQYATGSLLITLEFNPLFTNSVVPETTPAASADDALHLN